jgi:hypothetical protein
MNHRFLTGSAAVALAIGLAATAPARADDTPPPHPMVGSVMFSGWVEGGTNINPSDPKGNINFGQLMTERDNTFRMNQLAVMAEKDLDPAATGMDWGFKVEGLYGTDARITHTFGLLDRATKAMYQWDLVEANLQAHLPVFVTGGLDLKAGIYSTPIGYEVINAPGNFFYTHSYIFNYGIPLKHTGVLGTLHVNSMIDLWAGVDTGVNAGLPLRGMDNNSSAAGLFGFGLNNPIPNLTILALAHYGPENAYIKGLNTANATVPQTGNLAPDRNKYSRQIYDIVTTYKLNDSLTLANELNVIKDDLSPFLTPNHSGATAEGAAFYGIYKFNDQLSFGARAEIFRDDQGFFVTTPSGALDFVSGGRGFVSYPGGSPSQTPRPVSNWSVGKATYGALTLGANYTPPLPALPLNAGLTIRPEIRWDHAWGLAGSNKAFNPGSSGMKDNDQFLFSVDAIFGF